MLNADPAEVRPGLRDWWGKLYPEGSAEHLAQVASWKAARPPKPAGRGVRARLRWWVALQAHWLNRPMSFEEYRDERAAP